MCLCPLSFVWGSKDTCLHFETKACLTGDPSVFIQLRYIHSMFIDIYYMVTFYIETGHVGCFKETVTATSSPPAPKLSTTIQIWETWLVEQQKTARFPTGDLWWGKVEISFGCVPLALSVWWGRSSTCSVESTLRRSGVRVLEDRKSVRKRVCWTGIVSTTWVIESVKNDLTGKGTTYVRDLFLMWSTKHPRHFSEFSCFVSQFHRFPFVLSLDAHKRCRSSKRMTSSFDG